MTLYNVQKLICYIFNANVDSANSSLARPNFCLLFFNDNYYNHN